MQNSPKEERASSTLNAFLSTPPPTPKLKKKKKHFSGIKMNTKANVMQMYNAQTH